MSSPLVPRARKILRFTALTFRNLLSRKPVTAPQGPVVSMTSYGRRIRTVHIPLESIAAGAVLPSRLVLWLDDADAVAAPTRGLRRLLRRGLEIRHCADDGPHKKYYPYVQSVPQHTVPLVTADDDWMFPTGWLGTLLALHAEDPTTNTSHRARDILVTADGLTEYAAWPLAGPRAPSNRNLATGGWGHVLVPAMLEALRGRHEEFRRLAPRADDVWLHRVAVESGTAPSVVGRYDHHDVLHMPIGDGPTLASDNVGDGGNDRQIRAAWPDRLIEAVIADPRPRRPATTPRAPRAGRAA
ncbi:hypothetical protein Q7F20_08795 [Curtobacterium sp. A7_M15]|uniref:hypothetical protein n=1 Tax=Curtobacterium sp. A7_M15 TaxID=3065241 RepID=UPI002737A1AB|nr:hypothetical protein [Curtobacterium sp. A7_M15]MDP4333466.1 hypothetical protein [Curtobacterium sp. A7_M15]